MNKKIEDVLDPNREWIKLMDNLFEIYQSIYNLPLISKSQIISDVFYNYCLKGKYFVVIALYNSKRDFFIQKDFLKHNNEWELVGGWVRKGENFDQALNRIVNKETGNKLVEAIPVSAVNNTYYTKDKKKVIHVGFAYLGRVLHDSISTQNGIFTSNIDKLLSKSDLEILKLCKKILKNKIIEPPLDEVENHESSFLNKINKHIIKPLVYNLSSRILFNEINNYIVSISNKKNRLVLDVACGDDKSILKIANNSKLFVANDISRETMISLIKSPFNKNIIFTNQNLLEIKYKIKFDVVLCKNVIHHMRTAGEIGILLSTLKNCGKRVIIMDIEDPSKSFIAKAWNFYYRYALNDHGGLFISYNQFKEILNISFAKASNVETRKIKTIKGTYMLGVIDL